MIEREGNSLIGIMCSKIFQGVQTSLYCGAKLEIKILLC